MNKLTKTMSPNVSIIIPSYNGWGVLEECLTSLSNVAYRTDKIETIIVDDGSTDNTAREIRKRFRNVKLLRNSTRLGFVRSIEAGVNSSRGTVLVFLNNDMRVEAGWLRALVGALSPAEGVVCSCSHILNWDGSRVQLAGRDIDAFALGHVTGQVPSTLFTTNSGPVLFAPGSSMAVLRRVYSQLSGFDPDYTMYHVDVDFGWRLWTRGYKVKYCKESVVYHRGGSTLLSLDSSSREEISIHHIRNMLYTVIKDSDAQTLNLLPAILAFIEHNMMRRMEFKTVARSIVEVGLNLRELLVKRSKIQLKRIKSDSKIFAETGHPFQFLLDSEYISKSPLDAIRSNEAGLEKEIIRRLINLLSEGVIITKDLLVEEQIRRLQNDQSRELQEIKRSFGYNFMKFYATRIDQLCPSETRRGEARKILTSSIRVIMEEGGHAFIERALEKIKLKNHH